MKRNMAIIRAVLEYLEHACKGDGALIPVPSCELYSDEELSYHVGLCFQAGYMEGKRIAFTDTNIQYQMIALTWKGYEKLAELRKEMNVPK